MVKYRFKSNIIYTIETKIGVSCSSCSSVISQIKSMDKSKQLYNIKCYGIIDRAYGSDYEI